MEPKLQLLPGVGFIFNEDGRWQPAQIDRAAHLTAQYVDRTTIGDTQYAVFEDGRGRRWAKQHSVVVDEQLRTWSATALFSAL